MKRFALLLFCLSLPACAADISVGSVRNLPSAPQHVSEPYFFTLTLNPLKDARRSWQVPEDDLHSSAPFNACRHLSEITRESANWFSHLLIWQRVRNVVHFRAV